MTSERPRAIEKVGEGACDILEIWLYIAELVARTGTHADLFDQ
jgi:hypothetical protein